MARVAEAGRACESDAEIVCAAIAPTSVATIATAQAFAYFFFRARVLWHARHLAFIWAKAADSQDLFTSIIKNCRF